MGTLSGFKNRSVLLDRLQRQTQWAQENGFAGVAYFFYESLWNLINPVEQTSEARQAFFQQFGSPRRKVSPV